jgi:hypothetical protein
MGYLTDELTVERWVLIFGLISGLIVGYGVGGFEIALGGPAYKVGYADGRSQAHRDLAGYCETHWTEYVMPEEEE